MSTCAPSGLRLPRFDQTERLVLALALAASVHALLLFGLQFLPETKAPAPPTLEVTLSQFSEAAPAKADFAAPANQTGSGDASKRTELTSTQASDFAADRDSPLPEQRVDTRANTATASLSPITLSSRTAPATPEVAHDDATPGATIRESRPYLDVAQQLATLQARLADESMNQALGPRVRRITSVSTLATDEAYYLNSWRREVEAIGNLNYPAQARTQRVHGSVRMLVAINPDGTLKEAMILESSGYPLLDAAALNIVRLAAPFPVFPESMRKRIDTLEFIRTWQFRPSKQNGDGFSG